MKGYRTLAFNLIVALAPVLDFLAASGEHLRVIIEDPKHLAWALFGIGLANVALRALTTSAIFKRES